jgi:hypothetical protein
MAWRGFLASRLFPAATPLHARFDDSVEAVLAKIPPNATHFLFHINVSVTAGFPARRAELLAALEARGIRTINDCVTDISKPALQRTFASLALPVVLADRTLPADTPVIVKTSLNHGSETERYLPAAELTRLGMHLAAPGVGPDYRVMPASDVPGPSWDDKALCIERVISNDEGRYHRAYLWQDRLVLWEGINPAPTKKSFADTSNRFCVSSWSRAGTGPRRDRTQDRRPCWRSLPPSPRQSASILRRSTLSATTRAGTTSST